MLHTVPAFDRLGEENAFAVLARATALASEGKDIILVSEDLAAGQVYGGVRVLNPFAAAKQ